MAYEWAHWLPGVLRAAGCTVVESDGWRDRGRPGGSFTPRGIMLHHDASPPGETSHGDDVLINGRPGLEGPLCHLWLDFDGRWHIIAAGRANHAGEGRFGAIPRDAGNTYCIGIETDHTTDEMWSEAQRSEALRGVAALADHLGIRDMDGLSSWFCAHKEYAPDRKIDPDPLNMDYARDQLYGYEGGEAPVQRIQKSCSEVRTLVNTEWRDLRFTTDPEDPTGMYAMGRGPAGWFDLAVQVYASGPPGARFQLRPYKDGGEGDTALYQHRTYTIDPDGRAAVELTQSGSLADGKWLRVQGWAIGAGTQVTLTATRGQAALW